MDLLEFLLYLHSGASSLYEQIINHLQNAELKALRHVCKPLADDLFPRLFQRIYISAHQEDLDAFVEIARRQKAAATCRELIWDDTTYHRGECDLDDYRARLDERKPLRDGDDDVLRQAHAVWSRSRQQYFDNVTLNWDLRRLSEFWQCFRNLESVTVISRSRLTYVDPEAYWQTWQTPRSRRWRQLPCYQYLLEPDRYRPATGTTVRDSEGVRPVMALLRRSGDGILPIGALNIQSIGGPQTRASGGMTSGRYERKWHIDLNGLVQHQRSSIERPKVCLNLLLEMQTQDLWRQEGIWESVLWMGFGVVMHTLEEITFSSMCLDWFWHSIQANEHTNTNTFSSCGHLRKLSFRNCWCSNPLELLAWISRSTSVGDVQLICLDMETSSWPEVVKNMKEETLGFESCRLTDCRSPSQQVGFGGSHTWAAPWSGDTGPWLRGESSEIGLTQG